MDTIPLDIKIKNALQKVKQTFGKAIADNVERIYRLETAHFSTNQFKQTFSPGMEKAANTYPYGWTSLHNALWSKMPEYKPTGYVAMKENKQANVPGSGIVKNFLKFTSVEAGFMTLGAFLQVNGNNPGRWFSLDKSYQEQYNKSISQIVPKISNTIV